MAHFPLGVANINVRSLINGFSEFSELVYDREYDLIAVTETCLSHEIPSDLVSLEGFSFTGKDRLSRDGGVGIYTRSTIRYKTLMLNEIYDGNDFEDLWIKIKINKIQFIIGVLYYPPHLSVNFVAALDSIISYLTASGDNIIIVGDVDVDLLKQNNPLTILFSAYNRHVSQERLFHY